MSHCCVHVHIDLDISTDAWVEHCASAVPTMLGVRGLVWKLWLADAETRSAGGVYLFVDRDAATAYVSGPIIARLRTLPGARAVRTTILDVADALSVRTHALAPSTA